MNTAGMNTAGMNGATATMIDAIRNRDDYDRDGDGIPNRYDSRPDNPRRH